MIGGYKSDKVMKLKLTVDGKLENLDDGPHLSKNLWGASVDISSYVYITIPIFSKIHMHNVWLLERSELKFDLPEDFFDSPLKLFLFCGNVKITD